MDWVHMNPHAPPWRRHWWSELLSGGTVVQLIKWEGDDMNTRSIIIYEEV